jgi:hypothetical protein
VRARVKAMNSARGVIDSAGAPRAFVMDCARRRPPNRSFTACWGPILVVLTFARARALWRASRSRPVDDGEPFSLTAGRDSPTTTTSHSSPRDPVDRGHRHDPCPRVIHMTAHASGQMRSSPAAAT